MLIALTPESSGTQAQPGRGALATERELIDAIRSGDEREAGHVYARLLPVVDAALARVLGAPHRQHAELVQRSIERIIVALSSHPSPWKCTLECWASALSAQVALDVLRARARSREVEVSWGDTMARASIGEARSPSPGSAIDRLRWMLAELPAPRAEAVVLCDVLGLTAGEVAVVLGVSVDHLRRLLAAAHERLSRALSTAA